jgi:hypothetical protein
MSIIIPQEQLQPDTLQALIEEFVTRSGAVHGHTDTPLSEMIEAVQRQLKSGEAVIVFDEEEETFTIVRKEQMGKASQSDES